MTSATDISVIVPTYNSSATLARALQSLLDQRTDAKVEIVVTDDASTDATLSVAEDFMLRHPDTIKVLTSELNRGVATNYYDAFTQCQGRYITDCAPDDYWLDTNTLQSKLQILESNPEAVAVYSPWMEIHPDGVTILRAGLGHDIVAGSDDAANLRLALLRRSRPAAMHLSTVLYRASTLSDALSRRSDMIYNPAFGCEDTPLLLALAGAGTILFDPTPSLAYTVGLPSISNDSDTGRRALFSARASMACYRLALYYGIPVKHITKSLRHHLTFALGQARHSGRREVKREVAEIVKACGVRLGLRGWALRLLNL